jgi:ribosomal protein S18 acetylase RimI-like enzyme
VTTSTVPTVTTTTTATTTSATDRDGAIATLVVAFAEDPVIRWMYPDPARFLTNFPEVLQALGGAAFDAGTADRAGAAGAALWVPPDVPSDDEAIAGLLVETIDVDRHEVAFTFLGQVQEFHPTEACWYLPFIGVDPHQQGRGHGSALLRHGLARCDRDGLPAYLEASSPRNRALYERHGFEVLGQIQAGDSPPLWPMLRQPS